MGKRIGKVALIAIIGIGAFCAGHRSAEDENYNLGFSEGKDYAIENVSIECDECTHNNGDNFDYVLTLDGQIVARY